MRFAKHLLITLALLMTFAATASYAQSSSLSTRNSSAKAGHEQGQVTPADTPANDAVLVAGCEKAAKEVAASREYIEHLEKVKTDYEQMLALEAIRASITQEQLAAKRTEATELREALKAEREALAASRREVAMKDERIAKLERRKGGLKQKIVTVAIGAAIGAVLR